MGQSERFSSSKNEFSSQARLSSLGNYEILFVSVIVTNYE